MYFQLCWIFTAVYGLSLIAVSGGCSFLGCEVGAFSLRRLLLLVEHRFQGVQAQQLWCMDLVALVACGIFPDQGSSQSPLHCQVDSLRLNHQGRSPILLLMVSIKRNPRQIVLFQRQYLHPQSLQKVLADTLSLGVRLWEVWCPPDPVKLRTSRLAEDQFGPFKEVPLQLTPHTHTQKEILDFLLRTLY